MTESGAAPLGGHTPGPWGFDTLFDHLLVMARYKPLPEFCVADLGPGQAYPSANEQLANARLIAAAPELLEACLYAERNFGRLGAKDVTTGQPCWEVVHAAIAKARGEQ